MTLADLYKAIDWSGADTTLARWEAQHGSKDETSNTDFRYRWRCVLLESALYGDTEERMREARGWLAMAGVWHQVVAYLQKQNLI
jgi:hypothetical protein